MAVLDGYDPSRLQFVVDALRTAVAVVPVDLTTDKDRKKMSTNNDQLRNGRRAIRNPDGTGMTYAQIAAAANLTVAQVQDLAGRI
jgi:hypothetical protein